MRPKVRLPMSTMMTFVLLFIVFNMTYAQGDSANSSSKSMNPIVRFNQFVENISSSEERLIHRERMGSYLVNVDGQRLTHHPYLKFDITKEGQALSQDAQIKLETKLNIWGKDAYFRDYAAVRQGDLFVVDPLDLTPMLDADPEEDNWMEITVIISEAGKTESKVFNIDYYPPRPDFGFIFRFLSMMIPIIMIVLAVVIFRVLGLKRNQKTDWDIQQVVKIA